MRAIGLGRRPCALGVLLLIVSLAPAAYGQDESPDAEPGTEPTAVEAEPGPVAAANDEIEQQLAAQQQEIAALKEQLAGLTERMDEADAEEELELELELAGSGTFEPSFNIHGFFDLNLFFFKYEEDEMMNGVIIDTLTFMINRLNLYFQSQMTETLSVLLEVRFTFMPLGYEASYEDDGFFGTEYDRVDTRVIDPYTSEELRLGGLIIERAHLTWKPHDAFGVIAGRYLTPFGIWNVDHGSPVLIPIRVPYFMVRNFIPPAQLGLQAFGRFFPARDLYLDYAITVSNGRGSTEASYDLDDNKAIGGRLRAAYEGTDVACAIGGYVFYGTVRDVTKRIDGYDPFHIEVVERERYSELYGSGDLLLKLFDARLQFEYVRGMVRYQERPLRRLPIVNVDTPLEQYQPDYVRWAAFGMLSYDFFFDTRYGEMSVTPYWVTEYNVDDDTFAETNVWIFRGGLNYKPSPFVTLKAEVGKTIHDQSKFMKGGVWSYSGQLAVSF